MSIEKKLPKYIDIKFTKNQRLYFKQVLDSMYITCEKECYPMYFGFLESCLKSIIEGESKTLEITVTKKEDSNGNTRY